MKQRTYPFWITSAISLLYLAATSPTQAQNAIVPAVSLVQPFALLPPTGISPNNVLSLISLKCYRTAGNTGTDQISLEVDYQRAWGPYPMKDGDEVNLINVIPIHYSARIEFFVHDANGTKTSLGSRRLLATGGKPFTFNRNGAYYTLTYEVEE